MNKRAHKRIALLSFGLLIVGITLPSILWIRKEQSQYALNRQLIAALVHDDMRQAFALVNAGADPNTRLEPMPAPSPLQFLHLQPQPSNTSPTAFLMVCGADCTTEDIRASRHRCSKDNLPLVQAMLNHHTNVNALYDDLNISALWAAVTVNHPRLVEVLLRHGADVNARNKSGMTPLLWAVYYSSHSVPILLAHGADVKLQNDDGGTALLCAAAWNTNKDMIRQLLASGANPNHADRFGNTPLSMAQARKRTDVVALLRQAGAKNLSLREKE